MKQLEMRRKNRQKDESFALEVLDEALFVNISMYDGSEPYIVPISHVRKIFQLMKRIILQPYSSQRFFMVMQYL